MKPEDVEIHTNDELPEGSRAIVKHAYNHALRILPNLDEESFTNGFLYGLRFGSTTETLKLFMGEAF